MQEVVINYAISSRLSATPSTGRRFDVAGRSQSRKGKHRFRGLGEPVPTRVPLALWNFQSK